MLNVITKSLMIDFCLIEIMAQILPFSSIISADCLNLAKLYTCGFL